MMNFEEFKAWVKENITSKDWKETSQVEISVVKKNNGVSKAGLFIRESGQDVSPILYLDDYYIHCEPSPPKRKRYGRGFPSNQAKDVTNQKIFQEIFEKIDGREAKLTGKLSDTYILGYYHQKESFYQKQEADTEKSEAIAI